MLGTHAEALNFEKVRQAVCLGLDTKRAEQRVTVNKASKRILKCSVRNRESRNPEFNDH